MRLDDLARRAAERSRRAAAEMGGGIDAEGYRRQRARRGRLVGAVATGAVIVVAVAFLVVMVPEEETVAVSTTSTVPGTTTVTVPSAPPPDPGGEPGAPVPILGAGWEALDAGPIAGRYRVAAAWAGSEIFAWGGVDTQADVAPQDADLFHQDGFLFDHEAGGWRPVSPAPAELCRPLREPWAISAGDRIVLRGAAQVVDGCTTAAAYHPPSDTWTPLRGELFERAGRRTSVVWTGELLVAPAVGWAYHWTTGESIRLPDLPQGVDDGVHSPPVAHWDGTRVLSLAAGVLREWRPGDDAWRDLADPPVPERARDSVWTDQGLLVATYDMATAFYADGEWSRPGDLPLRFYECLSETVSVGGTPVVRMCSGLAIWDQTRASWIPVALSDVSGYSFGALVGTEDALYEVGPYLRRLRIERDEGGSIVVPPTIPIGVMQLDIPDGFEFVSSFAPEQDPAGFIPDDSTIGVVFATTQGTRCTVTSTYGYRAGVPFDGFSVYRESGQVGGKPVVEYIDEQGTVGVAYFDSNGSDVVLTQCEGPSVSENRPAVDFISGLWSPWEEPIAWVVHESGGLRFEVPAGWIGAEESLTPGMVPAFELFSVGTYPMRPGGDRGQDCRHVPQFALDDLGPGDVFLSVHGFANPPARPRPEEFTSAWFDEIHADTDMPDRSGEDLARACLARPDREGLYLRWATFGDGGRGFLVILAVGPDASAERRAQVLGILDSMEWVGD